MNLSIVSSEPDPDLARIRSIIEQPIVVGDRLELEVALHLAGRECSQPLRHGPHDERSLDFIGHSVSPDSCLRIGDLEITNKNRTALAFFAGLTDEGVWARLGVTSLRLLGCGTATTDAGLDTIARLAEICRLPVFGTTTMTYSAHYDRAGFADDYRGLLLGSDQIVTRVHTRACVKGQQTLDVDRIARSSLDRRPAGRYPRRLATTEQAAQLIKLVDSRAGAPMPGLLAEPSHEVVIPHAGYHCSVQLLADFSFVRVFFADDPTVGMLFPVVDATALGELIDQMAHYW